MRVLPAARASTEVPTRLEAQLGENEEVGSLRDHSLGAVARSAPGHRPVSRSTRLAFVEGVLTAFPTLSFDLVVARAHAMLWSWPAAAGTEVGAHDRLVAATAMSAGWRVATANVRHFDRVPGLDVKVVELA